MAIKSLITSGPGRHLPHRVVQLEVPERGHWVERQRKHLRRMRDIISFYFICIGFYMSTDIYIHLPICSRFKVAGDKGISETKSKQQSPCSNCMHRLVMSWVNACSTSMHKPVRCMYQPVMSQADACSYCMGSVVLILSWIYLYSNYFVDKLYT